MSLASNIGPRLRLLRTAFTRRFIWTDLTGMVKAHGYESREIRANTHPLHFARRLMSHPAMNPPPDFAGIIGPANKFDLAGTYAWNSEPSVSEFLGELAFHQRAKIVVELGCFVGWTSAHLALGLKESTPEGGELWCLDCSDQFLAAARSNLARLGLAARISFIQGLSLDPKTLESLPENIDLLFIDTSHEYEATLAEISSYLPRLSPSGIIALHDSISQNGVRRAVFDLWPEFETLTFATEFGNGLTLLRRATPPVPQA